MGAAYETSKWSDFLWKDHLDSSSPARCLIADGAAKNPGFPGFAGDIHYRLYSPSDPPAREDAPSWATKLHDTASEMKEWKELNEVCKRNGFAAGIATEQIVSSLIDLVPEEGQGIQEGEEGNIRRAIRGACKAAQGEIEEAQEVMEGVGPILGQGWGGGAGDHGSADPRPVREAHKKLMNSRIMRRVFKLAGRLTRMALSHKRTTVTSGTGELHGVETGSELARLLPSELSALASSKRALRLLTLSKIAERKALVYATRTREEEVSGPIIVLLDCSGSMGGSKIEMAQAVALTLLSLAAREKRACVIAMFDDSVFRSATLERGADIESIISAVNMYVGPSGGTEFEAALGFARQQIEQNKVAKKADIIMVTDGICYLTPEFEDAFSKFLKKTGTSLFGIGILTTGIASSLGGIASSLVEIHNLNEPDPLVPILAAPIKKKF